MKPQHWKFNFPVTCRELPRWVLVFMLCWGLGPASTALAATRTWTGASPSSANWTDAANWLNVVGPVPGDNLVFPANAARHGNTNTFAAGTPFASLAFLGSNYVIYGNSLVLNGNVTNSTASATNSFYPDIQLGTNVLLDCVNGAATLALGSDIALNSHTLTVDGAGTTRLAGSIGGSGQSIFIVGEGQHVWSLVHSGPGTLVLEGSSANTYTGETLAFGALLQLHKVFTGPLRLPVPRIAIPDSLELGGIVQLLASDQVATSAPVIVHGTLDANIHSQTLGPLTITADNVGGVITNGTGLVTLGADVTVPAASYSSYLKPHIWGNLALGGATRTFNIGGQQSTLTIDAVISGTNGLTKAGDGPLSLKAANTYTGPTMVNNGELHLDSAAALGAGPVGVSVTQNGSLVIGYNIALGAKPVTLNGSSFANGFSRSLSTAGGDCSWSGDVILNDNVTIGNDNGTLSLSGAIQGSGSIFKTGGGTLILNGKGANSYTGITMVQGGVLGLSKPPGTIAVPGGLIIGSTASGAPAATVRLAANDQLDNLAPVTINSSGGFDLAGFSETIGSLAGSGAATLGAGTLAAGASNVSTNFDGVISGVGGLTKQGLGVLTLRGNNTYSGPTTINGGSLVVNGSQPATPVTVNAGATLAGAGSVGKVNVVAGQISPGPGIAVLTCGSVTLNSVDSVTLELAGSAAGTGYDQLKVAGPVSLGNSVLNLLTEFGTNDKVPAEGDQFLVLKNEGSGAITGTFRNLPDGSIITKDGLQFQISYNGGVGHDVVLTLVNSALGYGNAVITGGNGNGFIDPNECDQLQVVLANQTTHILNGISGKLTTSTPGVSIRQGVSSYPDVALGGTSTNSTPFQISLAPSFVCGMDIQARLIVTTAGSGSFAVPFVLRTGLGSAATQFDNNAVMAIGGGGTISSPIVVSNVNTLVSDVSVSLHITYASDRDLKLSLVAPDGTTVGLSSGNGGTGENYGSSCREAERTIFTDQAAMAIANGTPPFVGWFRPESPLSVFRGRTGPAINGTWYLGVQDTAILNPARGSLNCWSLAIVPASCPDGGGQCAACPGFTDEVTTNSPVQAAAFNVTSVASTCESAKPCPGTFSNAHHYNAYTFTNLGPAKCVTVTLATSCPFLFCAAYLNSFNSGDICANYLGDLGYFSSTSPGKSYSFKVPADAVFVVVVDDRQSGVCGQDYNLVVSDFTCPPTLAIQRAVAGQTVLAWPTYNNGFVLESAPSLPLTNWTAAHDPPMVVDGKFTVTNATPGTERFYRLHRP